MPSLVEQIVQNSEVLLALLAAIGLIYKYRVELLSLGHKEESATEQLKNGMLEQARLSIKACNEEVAQLHGRLDISEGKYDTCVVKSDKLAHILSLTRRELRRHNADNVVLDLEV